MARYTDIVIQKHIGKRSGLHFDLRLLYPYKKSLASWALPRGRVPQKVGDRALAVRTSDHPVYWGDFSGTFTSDSGEGTVEIIQKGKAELFIWTSKLIVFKTEGPILDGKYALILFKREKKQTNWVLLRAKDKPNEE
jgi:hypothetical protein